MLLATGALLIAMPRPARADERPILSLIETGVSLGERRSENDKGIINKYVVRVRGRVAGSIDGADRVKIEWKAGGKVAGEFECDIQGAGGVFDCASDDEKPFDHHGALQAVFSYVDDSEDTSTPIYTMNLRVGRFWNWYQRGKKTLHYPKFQLVLSDLQGSAVVRHEESSHYKSEAGGLEFFAHVAAGSEGWAGKSETLRCSVGGKKLTDSAAGPGDALLAESVDWRGPDADKHDVRFYRLRFRPSNLTWGTRDAIGDDDLKQQIEKGTEILLGDHPGEWSCDWRQKGKVLRTFTFTVGADGRVAPHPEQAAGLSLPPGDVMVGVSFSDDVLDDYFDPTAVKATGFFGRAWSAPGTVSALKLGKAKGPAELSPPKGAKGGTEVKAR